MVGQVTAKFNHAAAAQSMRWRSRLDSLGILPMLLSVCVLFALLTPKFLTAANLLNITRQASINVVLAAGMTFVILTRGIDLAVGSVLGVTAVIAVQLSLLDSWAWAAVPGSLATGAAIGALTGAAVAYGGFPPFIITLGTYTALRGVAYLLSDGTSVINSDLAFSWIGNDYLTRRSLIASANRIGGNQRKKDETC
jgi:ribose transport system permease protein